MGVAFGESNDFNPKEFWTIREKSLISERILLHTLSFDLFVDHPYKYVKAMKEAVGGPKKLSIPLPFFLVKILINIYKNIYQYHHCLFLAKFLKKRLGGGAISIRKYRHNASVLELYK